MRIAAFLAVSHFLFFFLLLVLTLQKVHSPKWHLLTVREYISMCVITRSGNPSVFYLPVKEKRKCCWEGGGRERGEPEKSKQTEMNPVKETTKTIMKVKTIPKEKKLLMLIDAATAT